MSTADMELDAVLQKLRDSLKRRGAEGVRGLGRHFKVRVASCSSRSSRRRSGSSSSRSSLQTGPRCTPTRRASWSD